MTVSITTSAVTYVGDGVQTDYGVPFAVLAAADLYVFVDGVLQVIGVGYNTVGDVTAPNSTVSFNVAPPDMDTVLIQRLTGLVQSTEYTPFGEYQAAQHESDFDKAMYIAQENRDAASGVSDVIDTGLFQTSINILNTFPQFGGFKLSYEGNIFGGAGALLSIPDNGTVDSISFSLYGQSNDLHTMVFTGDGILTLPNQLWITHPTVPAWGRVVMNFGDTFGGTAPWLREFLDNQGDLTGIGYARSFEWIDQANVSHALVMDPVSGKVLIDGVPVVTESRVKGVFDGGAVTQLSGSGFDSIIRTAAVPAGSWDVTLTTAIAIDDNMTFQVSGATFGGVVVSYNVGRIDDQMVRVTSSWIPDGTDVVNTLVDSTFHLWVDDLT